MSSELIKTKLEPGVSLTFKINEQHYELCPLELADFFNRCNDNLGIGSAAEFEQVIIGISDMIVDGANDNLAAYELKRPLMFLKELRYLFRDILIKIPDES